MAGLGYKDFTAGAVLTAAQVDGYLMEQAVMNFAGTAARGSALSSVQAAGMMAHVGGGTVTVYDGSAWQTLLRQGGGKFLQIVRATDTTDRTTTSTTAVDSNLSVTITPQLNTSAVLLICSFFAQTSASGVYASLLLTNASNVAVSGAERTQVGVSTGGVWLGGQTLVGYSTPATTAATTYKLRWFVNSGTGTLANATNTAQLFAIEVSA